MLFAVAIPSAIARGDRAYVLLVESHDVAAALDHLRRYEVERLTRRRPLPPAPKLYTDAWTGSLVYVIVILTVALVIANGVGRLDAFDLGELHAGSVQAGQWWRVWTALTLHVDAGHLSANAAAGAWFGYLASRLMGAGRAWLLVVLGAGLANGAEAFFAPAFHRSVGASTAVFTALGLMSAYSWRSRLAYPQRWALRWGPLVAGLLLLAWTGTGGGSVEEPGSGDQSVDVAAHALGFVVGLLVGAGVSVRAVARVLDRVPQWVSGLLALVPIVVSWVRALTS
ncbi:MAG TPA: rhomboid family intramembrane serine protease [Steroidobacteraceae bacterium]